MTSIRIRPATPADAAALSAFAAESFAETFARDNHPDDMAAYLGATFAPERQAAEIAHAAELILLAVDGAGDTETLVGYAHLGPGATPPEVDGSAPLELKRFYLSSAWHGRGLAGRFMCEVCGAAIARGARTLWLGVWERNARAIAFYRKVGYRAVGTVPFQLGRDRQTDVVMTLPLRAP